MYDAPGLGLAAPQVGVQKRFFVYDIGDGPHTLINPIIEESSGEWVYDEGCLSIPGLYVEIVRPKEVLLARLRPRRQRGHDRGRRAPGPPVPARARPPRRRAHVRAHDRRAAQGGAEGVAPAPARASPSPSARSAASVLRLSRPLTVALAPVPAHPRRLVFLGTPAMAVPPLRALVPPATTSPSWSPRADKRRGRGSALPPSPVKAAAVELGLPVTHRVDDALDVGADLGVVVAYGRLVKPPRARGAADGQPALLAAAPVAGRGAGRAGAPGRRHRDRRVPDAARGGPRHRRGVRLRAWCRSRPERRPRRCGPSSSRWAPSCWSAASSAGLGTPEAAGGRADLRRQDRRRRAGARLGPPGRSSSTAWCASAGRGRRSGAGG